MKKSLSVLICALFISMNSFAQKSVFLTIKNTLGNTPFAFNETTTNDLGNNLTITRIDYYMSSFKIIHDSGQIINVPDSVIILVKGDYDRIQNLGNYNVTNVEGITFSIGVPKVFNNTDPTLYFPPNALAPQSPSMHWGWTAGFRFVALEGSTGPSFNTDFQMHSLGNENYFSQTKIVSGVDSNNVIYINLDADYTQALKGIDVTSGPFDHGAGATDLTVLKNFRDYVFSPGTGIGLISSINPISNEFNIKIYPNPSKEEVYIENSSLNNSINGIEVYDITGKFILNYQFKDNTINKISIPNKGLYFLILKTKTGDNFWKKLIIE